uniref:ADP-L-glycero-D-manno-heptose-6-epimerase n=1 Tax=Magnetococcus massalia (strain MO-1) TaxID=451514 RepID=A0A1S7LDT3_MAGMO|nr:ADP-L-glycero-D-mannoheptose-6-epimerase [Candidatus Magnetococcus massalia]
MYIVTGGAGFIGANIIAQLNKQGISEILVVDNLEKAEKFLNIRDLEIADFMDKREFREHLEHDSLADLPIEAIFHQGACSDTMEYDGHYMMENNYTYSKLLLHRSVEWDVPFIYASSAATYGDSDTFVEAPENEHPLNVYGYSKLLFDRYVMRNLDKISQSVVGLRYFNVYGPRERHKGKMASMAMKMFDQLSAGHNATLFEGSGGYDNGEQRRDFIYVEDVARINLFLAKQKKPIQGVFNLGTGQSRSFNDVANGVIDAVGSGKIEYVPMPEGLAEKYQNFTEADMRAFRAKTGYDTPFTSLEEGLKKYVAYLQAD